MTSEPDEVFPAGMLPPDPELRRPYVSPELSPNDILKIQRGLGVASTVLRFAGQSFTDLDLGPRALRLPLDGEYVRTTLDADVEIEVPDSSGIAHVGLAPAGSTVYFKIFQVAAARWEPNLHTSGSWLFLVNINARLFWISQLDGPDANAQFLWQAHNELPTPVRPAGRAPA